MQVGLISVYESIMAYGLRCLSSVLKQAAISTRMVFLPRETEGIRRDGFRYAFSEGLLAELAELVKSCDLVGISVMSNYFENAVQITKYLNEHTAAQIIWGGIHTTLKPEECLEHADLVCVGEGEDALLELIKKMSESNGSEGIRNIWYKKGGEIIRTPLRPLETNLDQYPYPDYSLDDVFILYEGVIRPMTEDLLMYYLDYPHDIRTGPTYVALMSRGCTYSCTYCCNNALRRVYPNSWKVQRRSTKNILWVNWLISPVVIPRSDGSRSTMMFLWIRSNRFVNSANNIKKTYRYQFGLLVSSHQWSMKKRSHYWSMLV